MTSSCISYGLIIRHPAGKRLDDGQALDVEMGEGSLSSGEEALAGVEAHI